MAHVLDFLRAFALAHGLGEHMDCAEAFFEALQRQTGEHESVDVLGKLGPTATLLWTSAHKLNGVPVAHWARRRRVRSQNTCVPPWGVAPNLRASRSQVLHGPILQGVFLCIVPPRD